MGAVAVSAESVIVTGRRFQESQFVSSCIIRRQVGEVFNETIGEYEPVWDVVYSDADSDDVGGPCLLKFGSPSVREVDAQSQQLVRQQPVLKLPVDTSAGVRVDDVAELTSNPLDPQRVGLKVRVSGDHVGTLTTARRFPVEVVSGG